MKLKLINFKCYKNQEFDIPDQGLVLISAPSGSGKSTIIQAILFTLFDLGKKLVKWGEKSCQVTFYYRELIVTRSKRPNRLQLTCTTGKYEDATAQSIINQYFGSNFCTTSFVDNHNLRNSFILMSPTEKLAFLEQFAFNDINIIEIKEAIKKASKDLDIQIYQIEGKITTVKELINHQSKPETVIFPLKKKGAIAIKNEETRYKNTVKKISREKKNLEALREKAENLRILQNSLENYQIRKEEIINFLEKINTKISNISIISGEELENLRETHNLLILQRKFTKLSGEIETLRQKITTAEKSEKAELTEQIEKIRKNLTFNPKELENTLATLYIEQNRAKEYEKNKKNLEELGEVEDNLDEYAREIRDNELIIEEKGKIIEQLKLSQELLECPGCQTELALHYNPLRLVKAKTVDKHNTLSIPQLEREIKELKNKNSFLANTIIDDKKKLEQQKILKEKIEKITQLFGGIKINLKKIDEKIMEVNNNLQSTNYDLDKIQQMESLLRTGKFSTTIQQMKAELVAKEREILNYQNLNVKGNIEEIAQKLGKAENNYKEHLSLLEDKKTWEHSLKGVEAQIDKLEKSLEENSPLNNLEQEMENSKKIIKILEEEKIIHEKNLENIKKYQNYISDLEKYNSLLTKLSTLECDKEELAKRAGAIALLKAKVLESESLAIYNTINSINISASNYLNLFFPDDQIDIKLSAFKSSKNGKSEKPQINLSIIYKGEETDISSLSGGELARVVLAFTLALCGIFNTPFLLLDECTANLDGVNTQNVFQAIKAEFNNKLVLAIAHQVIEGSYDHVIRL